MASTQLPSGPENYHVVQGVGWWQAEGSLCCCLDHTLSLTHTHHPHPWPRTGKREIGVAPRTATEQGPKEPGRWVSSSVGWTGQLPPPEGWYPGSKAGTQAPVCLTVARPPALVLTWLRGILCGAPTGCQAGLSPYAQTQLPLRSLQGPQSRPPATDLPCVCARLPGLWSPC